MLETYFKIKVCWFIVVVIVMAAGALIYWIKNRH